MRADESVDWLQVYRAHGAAGRVARLRQAIAPYRGAKQAADIAESLDAQALGVSPEEWGHLADFLLSVITRSSVRKARPGRGSRRRRR